MFRVGQKVRIKDLKYNVFITWIDKHWDVLESKYSNFDPLTISKIVDNYWLEFIETNLYGYRRYWIYNFEPICKLPKNIKVI